MTTIFGKLFYKPPLSEKLRNVPGHREITNFFMKSFFRIQTIRNLELYYGVPENVMQSTRLFRILSSWKERKEKELWTMMNL